MPHHTRQSFEDVALPHLDAAYTLARYLLRNEEEVQDAVRESFLRALRHFAGYRGDNARAWLLTSDSIHRALGALCSNDREVLILREVERLSCDEIARVIGTLAGTVMSRSSARRKNSARASLPPFARAIHLAIARSARRARFAHG